uniref:Ovule protein n=1 Tax=Brugia pahangi TaxID=6280 RepID=A0A0N4U055_BRUPA
LPVSLTPIHALSIACRLLYLTHPCPHIFVVRVTLPAILDPPPSAFVFLALSHASLLSHFSALFISHRLSTNLAQIKT